VETVLQVQRLRQATSQAGTTTPLRLLQIAIGIAYAMSYS